jgi:cyanophycinase-like exopeptidase
MPRILALMGSGETTPSLSATHRDIFERSGPGEAILLDTPYGFQENAAVISAKTVEYFQLATQRHVQVASFLSAKHCTSLELEQTCSQVVRANWLFAGPGSPSYALRNWRDTPLVGLLEDKLKSGGSVVFASAAACVLGKWALPVYEIYKVGEEAHWLPGLDLLAAIGLPGACILPHYNNNAGGNHDTRFCYMGPHRLAELETAMEPDDYILGLDEHTAVVIDLDRQTAVISGKGALTIRQAGHSTVYPSGTVMSIAQLRPNGVATECAAAPAPTPETHAIPILEDMHRCQRDFQRALVQRQSQAALACLLEMEQILADWASDTAQHNLAQARSLFRGLLVEFSEAAHEGLVDPAQRFGPFVETLLDLRRQAREKRDWPMADQLRDRLIALGVEVQDTPQGTTWVLSRNPLAGAVFNL